MYVSTNHAYPSTCLIPRHGSVILSPDFSLHQPRGTIMAKRSVQPNLFSFLSSKISDIHTNKVKRSRVNENEEPDDSSSEILWGIYSGTPLNGHPRIADTHDITDNSESPDRPSIDFNT